MREPSWLSPTGLRPTLRQWTIFVAYSALVSAIAAPFLRAGSFLIASIVLPLSPPLLAGLVLIFDKPGPVKFWLVGLIASLTLAGFVAWLDVLAVMVGSRYQVQFFPLLVLLNALGFASLLLVFGRLPRRCPDCGRRSLLRLANLRWCASCGSRTVVRPANRGRPTPHVHD